MKYFLRPVTSTEIGTSLRYSPSILNVGGINPFEVTRKKSLNGPLVVLEIKLVSVLPTLLFTVNVVESMMMSMGCTVLPDVVGISTLIHAPETSSTNLNQRVLLAGMVTGEVAEV